MITIDRLQAFSEAAVAACENLKSWELVCSEGELKDIIDNVNQWPLLVSVLPSASGDDKGADNLAEENQLLFFVLKPIKESMNRTQRLGLWSETQQGMAELKTFIHDHISEGVFHDIFWDCKFDNRAQDPEYNVVDCSGWSLVFPVSIDGL